MKITPLDIRQKTFEKKIRGYDKDEVAGFLSYLSQEWEKLVEEKNALKVKYEQAEKEASKLREVEQSLFKTLKTAEDTGASIIEQANKTAELILKEAQMNADALNAESKGNARSIVEQAESQAKNIMEDLKEDVQLLVDNYEKLQVQRDYLLKHLKKTAAETLENVKTVQDGFNEIDAVAHTRLVKDIQRKDKYYTSMSKTSPKSGQENPAEDAANTYTWDKPNALKNQDEDKEAPNTASQNKSENPEPLDVNEVADETSEVEGNTQEDEKPKNKPSGSFFDQFE
ncbi:DivIVA domain-containing protein [Cyclobacterium plantarum]|uniref:DivIVA domain-containing protein n=1 Tax=Cyclobacterium plantarum TaxID=2716263 RepID=A0ABX0H7Z5_9BACT|nr:DivIVA domain-containing protein [Cyclobacterium plantarum]NHE57774.1 DivIVA domain-containing protein [Cyclobacterium plantarum]